VDKPSLFIGSSSEGLEFARAARSLLAQDAETTIWNEGFFGLGSTFIETLVNSLARFDFAMLVLTPDDLIASRKDETLGPRDNVIFELGLFMGRLGRARTFILHQSNAPVKIPSDLAGVTMAMYEWPRADASHRSALGAACDRIREVIRDLGISEAKTAKAINTIRTVQEDQARQLSRHQAEIRSLQVALQGIVTEYEYDKLTGLTRDEPFLCYYSEDLFNELKRLRAMGLIQHHEGTGLRDIRNNFKDRDRRFDLKRFFKVTPRGAEYLRLRMEILSQENESP
jgi:CAP12/Pycsar effector protein, TIR domain